MLWWTSPPAVLAHTLLKCTLMNPQVNRANKASALKHAVICCPSCDLATNLCINAGWVFSLTVYYFPKERNTSSVVGIVSVGMASRPLSSTARGDVWLFVLSVWVSLWDKSGVTGQLKCYIFHGALEASWYSHWKVACVLFYKVSTECKFSKPQLC